MQVITQKKVNGKLQKIAVVDRKKGERSGIGWRPRAIIVCLWRWASHKTNSIERQLEEGHLIKEGHMSWALASTIIRTPMTGTQTTQPSQYYIVRIGPHSEVDVSRFKDIMWPIFLSSPFSSTYIFSSRLFLNIHFRKVKDLHFMPRGTLSIWC